ncbi:MAG: tetratricopeptide repeat protein [Pirellulales bacterium]
MGAHTTAAEVVRFLENVFVAADPVTLNWFVDDVTKQDLDADELLDRASKRIRSELGNQPHIQARMMDTMANVYRSLGALDSAQKLLDDAEKIRESTRSERDTKEISRETTTHDFYRACLLQARGEQAGARLLLQTVMENRVRLDGPEARSVADTWFQIGWLHLEEQRSSEAEQAFSKALQIRKKHLPTDHPELVMTELALTQSQLRSRDSLVRALVLANTLTSSQAGQLVRDAIELQLARSQKNFDKAIAKYRSILASMETLLNPQDPRLLLAKGDLASLLWDAGHYEEAFVLIMPALEAGRKIAPKHPKLGRALVHVAKELMLCCRFEEAESLFREALTIPSASINDEAELIQGFASLLLATDRKDEARSVLDGFSAKDRLDIVPQIWLRYLRLLSLPEAEEIGNTKAKLLESLEQVTLTHLGSQWQSRMAIVLHHLDRKKESLHGHLAALQSEEAIRPPMHPRIADHLMALAIGHREQGEDSKALEYAKRSYEIRKASLPTEDPRIVQSRALCETLEQRARGE